MATASNVSGRRKWAAVLRWVGAGALGRQPFTRRYGRTTFRARGRRLPRVAWGRPALRWGLGRGPSPPPLLRRGAYRWRRSGRATGRRGPGSRWPRPRLPAGGPGRPAARPRSGPGLALLGAAAAMAVLVALPVLGGDGLRRHLAPYWEVTGAPLLRWIRLDEARAAWLVVGVLPRPAGGASLPAEPESRGSEGDPAGRVGELRAGVGAWLGELAAHLPPWMLVNEIPTLRPAGARTVQEGQEGPRPEALDPAPAEPAGARPPLAPEGAGEPLVLIYHSHTSEMYREPGEPLREPASYHRFNSVETGVVRAGRALARALEARGVPVLHDTGIYDYPSHPSAYLESGRAVAELLRRHPSIQAVIDLHRDTPADMTATVGGRRVARITLVVATAVESALPHPGWRQNLAFAEELARVLNQQSPGLLDRILQVPNRRYNQELHPRALLVELGSYHNTQAEADAAAELLADGLARVILGSPASRTPAEPEGPGRL